MLVLTGGSFKLTNMPGQLRNALPPPSFLSLGFSLVVKDFASFSQRQLLLLVASTLHLLFL